MRLSKEEIEKIKKTVEKNFGEAKVYLFGSRLDDSKKGGDIDLFIIPSNTENLLQKKIKTIAKLERILYKPVDIVVHKNYNRDIEQEALKGIKLYKF